MSRRGRPRAGEREERTQRVLDVTTDLLVEVGVEGITMLDVATRAGVSKESLYSWFDNRDGLFTALIERNADRSATRVEAALTAEAQPATVMIGYAIGLLTLLTTEPSISLNRAAMASPTLAPILLASGRYRVGPIVERYLASLHGQGVLQIPDPGEAFELFYGLVVSDTQIRVLLGDEPPGLQEIESRASQAVKRFVVLHAV